MAVTHLVFEHQDGEVAFPIEKAYFHITDDGLFFCWVFAAGGPPHGFISEPSFCFMRYPLPREGLRPGRVLEIAQRKSERNSLDDPSSHLYAGAYFDPWDARVQVLAVSEGGIEVMLHFVMDDPRYIDSRARVPGVSARTWMHRASAGDVPDVL